MIYPYW